MKVIYTLLLALIAGINVQAQEVDPAQLAAWGSFFDKTGGSSWTRCRNTKTNPCACTAAENTMVQCQEQDGVLYITGFRLRNNNLNGVNVPGGDLNSIISGSQIGFQFMDIGSNPNLRNTRGSCINIPSCNEGDIKCTLDYSVCATAGTGTPSVSPGSNPPTVSSLDAWKAFFQGTGGATWNRCMNRLDTPCECHKNQPDDAPIRVLCTANGRTITRLSMIDNNLVADEFPSGPVADLIKAGATYIDLSANPNLSPDEPCFDVPECETEGVTCNFAKPLCSGSLPPSTNDTTTTSPSPSGTESPGAETQAPTVFIPPTETPQNVTASPTVSGGSSVPTASNQTVTPTVRPTTSSPASSPPSSPPVTINTPSPTTSSAVESARSQLGVFVSSALVALALLA